MSEALVRPCRHFGLAFHLPVVPSLDGSPNQNRRMLAALMSSYEWERSEADAGTVVVALSGELDLTNAKELEQRLSSACGEDALLVVDVNDVFFLDSAALHVLFKLARARGKDRLVLLLEPGSRISRTLSLAGLDRVVAVRPSLDAEQRA